MSAEEEAAAADMCCASCGIVQIDDVELKKCDDCDLVKYCSDECQGNHRDQHETECRERRAELRDEDLFTLPDSSHFGECPLCCLPLSLDVKKSNMMPCCSKLICIGCNYANCMREDEAGLEHRCAFCREPTAKSVEEGDKQVMERIKKNDPVAMRSMGIKRYNGGDYRAALEYWKNAAELGDAEAHQLLSMLYHEGKLVEKNMKKAVFHAEQAAIAGDPGARYNLGIDEWHKGNMDRAVRHFIIAANLGDDGSLKELMKLYIHGHASKEDYAAALRAYQVAVDATKSSDREKAEEAIKNGGATLIYDPIGVGTLS